MGFCSACGNQLPSDAGFCSKCGAAVQAVSAERQPESNQEWSTFSELINTNCGILGTLGVLIAIIAAFLPWANVPVDRVLGQMGGFSDFGGPSFEHATVAARASLSWLVALAAAIGMVALVKRSTGIVTGVIGILITLYALLFVVANSGGATSPAPGAFFAMLGGAMMAYAGFAIKRA